SSSESIVFPVFSVSSVTLWLILASLRQRRDDGFFRDQLADVVAVFREEALQFLGAGGAVGPRGLLRQVVEQLLGERGGDFRALGEELRQFFRAGELRGRAGARLVTAGGVDRLALLFIPVSADR